MHLDSTSNTLELIPPRGILPKILLSQVKNTAPFLFTDPGFRRWERRDRHYLARLIAADEFLAQNADGELSHAQYFELCLSAHHGTVATFVPTDVDNQIRFKLWNPALPTEIVMEMADLVLASHGWDCTPVSARTVGPAGFGISGPVLSGHIGEWFSTAVGAYGALRKRASKRAADVAGAIVREVRRHAEIYQRIRKERDGLNLLRAATVIAHNLGDLDRVIEMWNLPADDPLRQAVFKCGHESSLSTNAISAKPILIEAGILNKSMMAHENHRHFALRGPRCLRKSADFLLPIGPFFDEWGARIARHPGLQAEEVGEICEALVDGWEWLRKAAKGTGPVPVGYARALSGIVESFPGGASELAHYVPARIARELKSGPLRAHCAIPQKRFEEQWKQIALRASS